MKVARRKNALFLNGVEDVFLDSISDINQLLILLKQSSDFDLFVTVLIPC